MINSTTPAIQNLARRLIALEAARNSTKGVGDSAVRACDKLRIPLAKLVGVAGFRSLITRAKALAAAEVPWLDSVQVREDGSLENFDAARIQQGEVPGVEAGVVIVSQLLGLLVTFIGEPLTLHLVRDAWPDESVTETAAESGHKS